MKQLRELRNEILKLISEIGGTNVRIFGSVARGEEKPTSDIDILIDCEGQAGKVDLDVACIAGELEALLRRPVHLKVARFLPAHVLRQAKRDAISLST